MEYFIIIFSVNVGFIQEMKTNLYQKIPLIKTEILMKVLYKQFLIIMEGNILAKFKMEKEKDMELCIILVEEDMKDIGKMI
jgi:hypothetical protein